ncbi:hypothetical protein B0J14DRAFT_557853 [Halenospora varia]|nr:hypothetical protein B0J14DRAFT_557853 [Halenospora varia]
MYLGAGIGNGTLMGLSVPASSLKKNTAIPPATGINSVASGLGMGLSASLVGSLNTSSLVSTTPGSINTAVLSLAQGLGGGAASGLGLKAANTTAFANDSSLAGIAGSLGQGLTSSFLGGVNVQALFGMVAGNMSTADTNAAVRSLAEGLGGGASSALKLVSNAVSNSTFLNQAGLSGIAGNLGQGLSTSFLTGVDLKAQLAQIGGNMTLSPAMVNSAALALAQGLGGGASSALGINTATPSFNTDGINGVAGNVGQGLSSSFLQNVSTAKLISSVGGGGVSFTGPQINAAALSLAQGLGSGAASALKIVSTPATNTSFNTDGINGIVGNVGQGLSTSFLQNFSVAQTFGGLAGAVNPQMISDVANGLGSGLGQGAVIGLGIQLEPSADMATANTTGSPIKPIVQSFGRGLTQSVLANQTLTKAMAMLGGNTTSNLNVGRIAQGFAVGLVGGAESSLQAAGGLSSLLGTLGNMTSGPVLTMPPPSTFDDSVGGAATGFGTGLGSEAVKGVLQAFGKPPMAGVMPTGAMNTSLAARSRQKRSQSSVILFKQKAAMDPSMMGNQMTLADVVDPILQKGIDTIGCQGIGGVVAIVLSVVPPQKLLSAAKSTDSLKNLTASFGSITNQTYTFEENGNTFAINIQNQDIRINGSSIAKFAALLVLHIVFAVIAFAIAVPAILILNSSRHFAVMTGRTHLLAKAQKWQMLIGAAVVIPSSILTFGFGIGGEGNRSHFASAHGVLGLLLFLFTFAAAALWQFRMQSKQIATANIGGIGLFLILIVLTVLSGLVDLNSITSCVLLFLPSVLWAALGFLFAVPLLIAVTMTGSHILLRGWLPENETLGGRETPDSESRPLKISNPIKVEHT